MISTNKMITIRRRQNYCRCKLIIPHAQREDRKLIFRPLYIGPTGIPSLHIIFGYFVDFFFMNKITDNYQNFYWNKNNQQYDKKYIHD